MRELTLLETGYLAGLLILSLMLPLLMSFRSPSNPAIRRSCLKTVWMGQASGAFCAAALLMSAVAAPYAAALGLVAYAACALVLHRQLQPARNA